jgi:hypothetical protein
MDTTPASSVTQAIVRSVPAQGLALDDVDVESHAEGAWRERRGRARDGYLDEKAAIVSRDAHLLSPCMASYVCRRGGASNETPSSRGHHPAPPKRRSGAPMDAPVAAAPLIAPQVFSPRDRRTMFKSFKSLSEARIRRADAKTVLVGLVDPAPGSMAPKCSDTEAPSEPPFDVRPKIECPIELGLAPFIQCVKKVSEFGGLRRPTEDEIDLEERIPRLFGSLEPHIETRVFQRDLAMRLIARMKSSRARSWRPTENSFSWCSSWFLPMSAVISAALIVALAVSRPTMTATTPETRAATTDDPRNWTSVTSHRQ